MHDGKGGHRGSVLLVLLAVGVLVTSLGIARPARALDSSPTQIVSATPIDKPFQLCASWDNPRCYALYGLVASPLGGSLVVTTGLRNPVTFNPGNALLFVSPSASTHVDVHNLSCSPFGGVLGPPNSTVYYPCDGPGSHAGLASSTLSGDSPTYTRIQTALGSPVFDNASETLVAPGLGANNSTNILLDVNPTDGSERLLGTFGWSSLGTSPLLVDDPFAGVVCVWDPVRGGVDALYASNGTVLRTLPVVGGVTALALDRVHQMLFVGSGSREIAVFNASSFAPEAPLLLPPGAQASRGPAAMVADPLHGDLYVTDALEILVFNESTQSLVGSSFPGLYDSNVGFALLVYDANTDQVFEAAPGSMEITVVDLQHSVEPSASDVAGTDLVYALAAGAAAVLLAVVGYRRSRPPARRAVPPARVQPAGQL